MFSAESKPRHDTIAAAGERDVTMSDQEIESIYGFPVNVNIYTGEIKYVGEHHVEYDFHTSTGCSVATVSLPMRTNWRMRSCATLARPIQSVVVLTQSWWIGTMAL